MPQRAFLSMLAFIFLAMAGLACDDQTSNSSSTPQTQLGPLDWNRDPDAVILRVDRRLNSAPLAAIASDVPLCTLWGDGRVTWLNEISGQGREPNRLEVLEAYLTDEQIRALIENVVFMGFYSWESNYLIPDFTNPQIESLSLNLFSEARDVSRYEDWPVDGFERVRQACTQASTTPALFKPRGAWISAYEIPYSPSESYWPWYIQAAGFPLSEVSNGGPPQWVSGDLAALLFEVIVLNTTGGRFLEGETAYQVAIQVPNLTRDAPPAPAP
jgi:hypothetical protein